MHVTSILAFLTIAVCALKLYMNYRRNLQLIGHLPGFRVLFVPSTRSGSFFPPMPTFLVDRTDLWNRRYGDFKIFGSNAYSAVPILSGGPVTIYLADADAIKQIHLSHKHWPKAIAQYGTTQLYGNNIIATEGDDWKRHRKVIAPAFAESNNKLVFTETLRIMLELFKDEWADSDKVVVDNFKDTVDAITLLVLSSGAFGQKSTWKEDSTAPPGYRLTLKDALRVVSKGIFIRFLTPNFMMNWTSGLRSVKNAFEDLERYMLSMIQEKRGSVKEDNDLFSLLIKACEDEGSVKLSDSELMGNVFAFLVAGQETTAGAISLALVLLSLHPEEQETLYLHINRVLSGKTRMTYADLPAMTQTQAVIYETLRLFPPTSLPKECTEETIITVSDPSGTRRVIPVPKGTLVVVHVPGIHYNPKYWENPNEFKPERFNGDWPREAFLPFAGGARSCLGRRFAEIEAIVVLTMIIANFKVGIKEESKYADETSEQRKNRLLALKPGLTPRLGRIPLIFEKRKSMA